MPKKRVSQKVKEFNNHTVTNPAKRQFTYTIKDAYKVYKKDFKNPISYMKYRDILRSVFAALIRKVIEDSWTFYLPFKLGALSRVSRDQRKDKSSNPVDYKRTSEKGKVVYHLNLHSLRRVYRIDWIKSFVKFKNKKYYKYVPSGGTLAKKYNTGKDRLKDYIKEVVEDNDKKLIK